MLTISATVLVTRLRFILLIWSRFLFDFYSGCRNYRSRLELLNDCCGYSEIMSNSSGEVDFDVVDSDSDDDYNPSSEKFSELLADLEREKQARVIAENSKSELQVSFNRLKALSHEAIRKRDEALRESSLLNDRLETQSKELSHKQHRIDELIQVLKTDIAAAGYAVEQEYLFKIASYKQEIKETKKTMLELVKKLKFKEETAENSFSSDAVSIEKLSELLAELEREKQARVIADNSNSKAIKKRDEWGRARDEALKESSLLNDRLETQSKVLTHRKHLIDELELIQWEANDNIQELKMEIVAAEEEITRWRGIAEEEAAARKAVEQEYLTQIQGLKMGIAAAEEEITSWRGIAEEEAAARTAVEQEYLTQLASYMKEIEEIKRTRFELMRKLKFKDEIAEIH